MPIAAAASSDDSAHHYRPGTPGSAPIRLQLADMDGIWKLAFGRFGWKDYDSRGAIIRIENGKLFGGGSNFVYRGSCTLGDGAVEIRIDVDRYRADAKFETVTGLHTDHFEVHCIADAITPDHFEGRISDAGRVTGGVLPELTLALMRFATL